MKLNHLVFPLGLIMVVLFALPCQAMPIEDLDFDLGLQYRIMYNNSNLPIGGQVSLDDAEDYDFFRQRFRLTLDVKPIEKIGGYAQFEFRNGWGVGPGPSDPRGSGISNVAFNRLSSRGVRYGYVYSGDMEEGLLKVGILPISDQLGDTLFSADWDFNVGGISYEKDNVDSNYRLAYLRLVEGIGDASPENVSKDGHFFILDYNKIGESNQYGFHAYHLANSALTPALGDVTETYLAVTGQWDLPKADVNGFILYNIGDVEGGSHNGFAIKVEGKIPVRESNLGLLAIYSTGDDAGSVDNMVNTPQSFLGTGGYWGYSHIFAANGPSDVNDLGLEIGAGGAGLLTFQGKLDFPVSEKVSGQIESGLFLSQKKRNSSNNIGAEIGGHLTWHVRENLNWEIGAAYGVMGDFYQPGADDLIEVFSRFQLEFN